MVKYSKYTWENICSAGLCWWETQYTNCGGLGASKME